MNLKFHSNNGATDAGATPVGPAGKPTTWWRSSPADLIDVRMKTLMRGVLVVTPLPGHQRWRDAAMGDAAAAIAVAIAMMGSPGSDARLDLAMTALALCALEGNAAACLVLSHIIRRLPNAGRTEARVATSWLLTAFKKLRVDEPNASAPSRITEVTHD